MSSSETIDGSLGSHLPPDIVSLIFVRLPVKSLCRFKCLSPSWNSLISSPQFAKTHLHITNTTTKPNKKTLLSSESGALYSVYLTDANPSAEKLDSLPIRHFDDGPFNGMLKVSGPCNGLLLVYPERYESYILWNPFTRQCKKLPKSPFSFSDFNSSKGLKFLARGLGYDSSTDDYKVVMVRNLLVVDDDVAVYSLKTDAWSIIQLSHFSLEGLHSGVYLNDRIHWLCIDDKRVNAFDLSDEIFREILLPDRDYFSDYMDVLQGCLCFLLFLGADDGILVWLMKEYGVTESWTMFSIVNPSMCIDRVLFLSANDEFVLRTYGRIVDINGEIVVDDPDEDSDEDKLVLYNPYKETVRVVIVPGMSTSVSFVGESVETLISPIHGGQIRRQCEASSSERSRSYQLIAKEHPRYNPAY